MQKFSFPKSLAFILSLIFLVHPVQVETVAYISITQDLLLVMFLLLGLLFTDKYCRGKRSLKNIFLIYLLIFFVLLSKEIGVVAVIIVPAFCYLAYKKFDKVTISFGVLPLLFYGFMRFIVAKLPLSWQDTTTPIHQAGLITRMTTFPYEMASYIRLIFFPKDLYISQNEIVNQVSDTRFYISLVILTLVLAIIAFLFCKYKSKLLAFFLLWAFLCFLAISNIVMPLDATVAERWMYIPLIGILGFLGLIITKLVNHRKTFLILTVVTLVFILLATIRTYIRMGDWYSEYTLASHDLLYEKTAPNLYNNYALELYKRGDFKNSIYNLEQGIKLKPDDIGMQVNLVIILSKAGSVTDSKKLFYNLLQNKNNAQDYDKIAVSFVNFVDVGQDPNIIISFLQKPLLVSPNDVVLNQLVAIAYFNKSATASALFYANRAYKLQPSQESLQLLDQIKK